MTSDKGVIVVCGCTDCERGGLAAAAAAAAGGWRKNKDQGQQTVLRV